MANFERAQYIAQKLNEKGAGLGSASWNIIESALAETDADLIALMEEIEMRHGAKEPRWEILKDILTERSRQ